MEAQTIHGLDRPVARGRFSGNPFSEFAFSPHPPNHLPTTPTSSHRLGTYYLNSIAFLSISYSSARFAFSPPPSIGLPTTLLLQRPAAGAQQFSYIMAHHDNDQYAEIFDAGHSGKDHTVHQRMRANSTIMELKKILGTFRTPTACADGTLGFLLC